MSAAERVVVSLDTDSQELIPGKVPQTPAGTPWTEAQCRQLQESLDDIFGGVEGDELKHIKFSLSIADPGLPDCPLIGVSDGFCDLTGHDRDTIVGQNCRFLIDPVPKEQRNAAIRVVAKDFINCVREGTVYKMPEICRQSFMPEGTHKDAGVFCLQMNAKKDGTLFRNMFYMKEISVNDRPYIIGLQSEVHDEDIPLLHQACRVLDQNMSRVQRILASKFWCTFGMDRQEDEDPGDGFVPLAPLKPNPLATKPIFDPEQAKVLQSDVDKIFSSSRDEKLQEMRLSLTIADPCLNKCPLVGCSWGFTQLTGYGMEDIVGHNCRFLVEPVPDALVSNKVKRLAREYCQMAAVSADYVLKEEDKEAWMPPSRHGDDGIFLAQRNARKDGTLFANMFYMRRVELDGKPFVLGLQAALPPDALSAEGAEVNRDKLQAAHKACRILEMNMGMVERALSKMFWYQGPMRRQEDDEIADDGFDDKEGLVDLDELTPPRKCLCWRSRKH